MNVEVGLQAFLVAAGLVEVGVGLGFIREAARHHIDMKIDAEIFGIASFEPQRGSLRLDGVFTGQHLLMVIVDVFERLTGSVVAGVDVGDDVEVVGLLVHGALRLRTCVADGQNRVLEVVADEFFHVGAMFLKRLYLIAIVTQGLGGKYLTQIFVCSHIGSPQWLE